MPYLLIIGGLALLGLGGEAVVRGAVNLAHRLGVSKLLVAIFLVAFATSSPELTVAIQSVLQGKPDIAVGNVIGSNIANLLLMLPIGALILPMACHQHVESRDLIVMLAVTALFVWLANDRGTIEYIQGVFFLSALLAYVVFVFIYERVKLAAVGTLKHNLEIQESMWPKRGALGWLIDFFWLGMGGVALFAGSNLLIDGVTELALLFGVWEGVIGLTVVAVGTSLPELATVVVAAWRRHPEIVVGGIIGSNIFNILAVLGVTALVAPVAIDRAFMVYDMWVMLGATLIVIPFFVSDWWIGRLEACLLIIGYLAYVASLYSDLIIVE